VLSWELCQCLSARENPDRDALGKRVSTDIGTPPGGDQSLFEGEVPTESPAEGPPPEMSF
jgi:hypothetical protein